MPDTPSFGPLFAQRVRDLRERAKLREKDLVAALVERGHHDYHARRMVRGDWYGMAFTEAALIADILKCSLDELAGRSPVTPTEGNES